MRNRESWFQVDWMRAYSKHLPHGRECPARCRPRRGGVVRGVHRIALAVLAGIVALMFASVGVSSGPPAATATATCADGGGVVWNLRSSWGAPYTSHGVRRVRTYGTEFTTSAPITRVQYAIRTYDGSGRLVQTLQGRR